MCLPDARIVTKQVKRLARGVKDLVAVAVATDSNDMIPELSKALARMEVSKLYRYFVSSSFHK